MPLYDYTGQLDNGAALQGTLEAESQEAAAQKLTDIGVRVAGLRAAQRFAFVTPLTLDDFLFLNEQIAGLSKAEVPLERGLRDLAADAASPKLKRLLLELAADLDRGTSLVDALERQKRRFPTDYAAIVRAGLATGDLGGALYGLTVQLRLRSSFRRSVLEMAAYPLTVVVMLLVIMGIAMRFIVPMMEDVFDDFGARLPGLTQLVLDAAHSWWLVELTLGVLLLLVVLFFGWPAHGTLRRLRETVIRRLPGFGQVYWSGVLARFAHTTALGAHAGTPLPEMIAAGGEASGSAHLQAATAQVSEHLRQGQALDAAAADEPTLPALWTCTVLSAAPRGDLAAALQELARVYEERAQHWASVVVVAVGPILFALVGGFLFLLVLAMFLPLTTLIQSISG